MKCPFELGGWCHSDSGLTNDKNGRCNRKDSCKELKLQKKERRFRRWGSDRDDG